jgi:hypothetical protein
MTDHVIQNGNIQMMIRDTGSWVEYWVLTDQWTYNHQQQWSGTGFGVSTFDMNNRGTWQYVNHVYIGAGAGQNVSFTMYDSGLGFPTRTYTVFIPRATAPPPPRFTDVHSTGTSTVHTQFVSQGDGGTPVREWQLAYGTNPNGASYYVGSNGINDVGGLSSGVWWYFWARGRNDVGWGGWSGRAQAFTWRVPDAPSPVTFSLITQTSIRAHFVGGFNGGESVDQWQLAYGRSSDVNVATLLTSNGTTDLSNLDPGQVYYFWARGRNAVGWGPWSSVRSQALRAGSLVKVGGVWKRALPYVNVNGVWKLAKPYARKSGVWKETA